MMKCKDIARWKMMTTTRMIISKLIVLDQMSRSMNSKIWIIRERPRLKRRKENH